MQHRIPVVSLHQNGLLLVLPRATDFQPCTPSFYRFAKTVGSWHTR